jgi:hypothetical protein
MLTQYLIGLSACSVPLSAAGLLRFHLLNSSSSAVRLLAVLGLSILSIASSILLGITADGLTARGEVLYCAQSA